MTKEPRPAKQDDVPTYLLIPAFTISELKTAFEIGFAIYIPFIVIDMVVASVLLSMGMMMIPPVLISLAVQDLDLLARRRLEPHRKRPLHELQITRVTYAAALSLGRDAIVVALLVCGPALLLGMITGLVISIFQATTQIQEPTLTFIPKIVVVALAILFFGPFMLAMLTDFMSRVFSNLPAYVK